MGVWLVSEQLDVQAGTDTDLYRVAAVFGAAQHHAYRLANKRTNRLKFLVHAASADASRCPDPAAGPENQPDRENVAAPLALETRW